MLDWVPVVCGFGDVDGKGKIGGWGLECRKPKTLRRKMRPMTDVAEGEMVLEAGRWRDGG